MITNHTVYLMKGIQEQGEPNWLTSQIVLPLKPQNTLGFEGLPIRPGPRIFQELYGPLMPYVKITHSDQSSVREWQH